MSTEPNVSASDTLSPFDRKLRIAIVVFLLLVVADLALLLVGAGMQNEQTMIFALRPFVFVQAGLTVACALSLPVTLLRPLWAVLTRKTGGAAA